MVFIQAKNNWQFFLYCLFFISWTLHASEISYEATYIKTKTTKEIMQASHAESLLPLPSLHTLGKAKRKRVSKSHRNRQTVDLNFTAATISNALGVNVLGTPLNINGWVGPKQYILMVYPNFRSFNKKTGQPDGILDTDVNSFFGFFAADVRLEYDRFANVWYASCEKVSPDFRFQIYLAVSDSGVITEETKWAFYNLTAIDAFAFNDFSFDYQQLALDQNNVYISADASAIGGRFLGTTALVINKSSLLAGKPKVKVFSEIIAGSSVYNGVGSNTLEIIPPADNFDHNPRFGYLANVSNEFGASIGFNQQPTFTFTDFYLYRIVHAGESHAKLTAPLMIAVPNYVSPIHAPHKGNIYGDLGFLQTGLFGGLLAPHVRDRQLFACHSVLVDAFGNSTVNGDRVGVRWYQFDLTGDPTGQGKGQEKENTLPCLIQFGTLYDPDPVTLTPKYYITPGIMTNKYQDLVIGATTCGENDYTNVIFASRQKNDKKGFLTPPVYLTHNNSHTFNSGSLNIPTNPIGQRWGDESCMALDFNGRDIWYSGEWAAVQNGWGVQVSKIKFDKR